MRKLIALALITMTASIGFPAGAFAQSPTSNRLATLSGMVADAGGRAVVSQTVELVQDGQIVQSATTGSRGEWAFTNVAPGDYVVRVVINGQVSGIRATVTAGQAVANALIVAPSAAAPSTAFLDDLGVLGATLVIGAIVAAVITTIILIEGS